MKTTHSRDQRTYFFIGMGLELVGMILGALYVGQILDERYGFGGLAVAFLPLLGLGGWIWHLMWMIKKYERDE